MLQRTKYFFPVGGYVLIHYLELSWEILLLVTPSGPGSN